MYDVLQDGAVINIISLDFCSAMVLSVKDLKLQSFYNCMLNVTF